MRGSLHTKDICEFDITENGMSISSKQFKKMSGILGGMPLVTGE